MRPNICIAALALLVGVLALVVLPVETQAAAYTGGWDGPPYSYQLKRVPPKWRKGVKNQDMHTLLKVAHAFEYGEGVSRDPEFAATWYLYAVDAGSEDAWQWIEKEAVRGENAAAMYYKGDQLRSYGNKTKEDAVNYAAGYELIRKAANAGFPEAEQTMGFAYFSGDGFSKDRDAALPYLKKAAVRGDTIASNHVTFGMLADIYGKEDTGYYNPALVFYYWLQASKLAPFYSTSEWVKHYDKIPLKQQMAIRKLVKQWTAGMPLWEGDKLPEQ
jgi:TPR repeat protein